MATLIARVVRRLGASVVAGCLAAAVVAPAPAQDPASPTPLAQPALTPQPVQIPDREIQVAADAFTRDATTPAWVQPHAIPQSKVNGNATLELLDTQWMVGSPTRGYQRRAVRINDATALTNVGRVSIPFIPAYQKVVLHTLQVRRDGAVLDRLASVQVRFLQRETALEQNLYSGIVTASILVDDLRVGDVLEVAFSLIGTNPVFGSRYSAAEGWDTPIPIGYRRVVLNAPVDRDIAWRFHGDLTKDFPTPSERREAGLRSLTFEGRDLAATTVEPNAPAGFSQLRWLQFSEYASWNDVASWAATLFDVHEAPNAERAALVATWSKLPTAEARAVAALEFVQSQIRYFSVSLGTSSHRPAAPNTVLARRYGDCKDKSLLLVTLLDDLGIKSVPVLARLGNRTGFDDWLPTPLAFDHAIVAADVDGVTWYLDSTRLGQHGHLATMGQAHDGSQVLAATATTTALHQIDVPNRDALTLDSISEKFVFKSLDGDAEFDYMQTVHGVGAEIVRSAVGASSKERLEAVAIADVQRRYAASALIDGVKIDDDRENNAVTIRYRATLTKPAQRVGNAWRINYRPDNILRTFALPSEATRRAPIAARYPITVRYRAEIDLPEAVSGTATPSTFSTADRYLVANSETTFRGNRATAEASMRALVDRVDAKDLRMYREDLLRFQRAFPGTLVVADADIKGAGVLGIGLAGLGATVKRRQDELVQQLTKTIDAGQLAKPDLAIAYCQRGLARVALEQRDAALADADAVMSADPDKADSLACRGVIRMSLGNNDDAANDLTQAIVLGSTAATVYDWRGRARFGQGRYVDAAQDFAKSGTLDRSGRLSNYSDLWQAIALLRAKRPLPDDLVKRAAADPRGAWPRPVLAMLAGVITPAELQAITVAKAGDEAAIDATEGNFYLGEKLLADGDRDGARTAFNAARAPGVVTFAEYQAAGIELRALDAAR